MRIVQACPYAWDSPGGVQVQVRQLAERLRAKGHDVMVVAPALRNVREDGVRVVGRAVRIPYQGTVAPIAPSPTGGVHVGRVLREFGPDVVHAHEPLTPSTSMWATLRSPAPVAGTFHAYAERSRLYDLGAPLVRRVWRRLAVRTAVSEAARSFAESRLGNGVRVVPNGIDVEMFRDAPVAASLPDGRRIVWVGRLDRQKGFPTAVGAFADVARDVPDVHLVVVGEGRDRYAVDALPPSIADRVHTLGAVEHERLPPHLAGAHAFLSTPTGQESFGVVLVEAMAAGVPVVATDIPGYREVVRDARDGLLVPPGDVAGTAKALRRILDDPSLAHRLAEAGRRRAEEYSWEVVLSLWEAIYEEARARGP